MKLLILILSCTVSQYVWAEEITDGCDTSTEPEPKMETPNVP